MHRLDGADDGESRPAVLDAYELMSAGAWSEAIQQIGGARLTRSWLRWHARAAAGEVVADDALDADSDWWAVEAWIDCGTWQDEALVQSALLDLIEQAGDDWSVVGIVAAGPHKDFIDGSDERLSWIEQQAGRSPRFRALKGVWVWELPEVVLGRLERAAGSPLPRPRAEG